MKTVLPFSQLGQALKLQAGPNQPIVTVRGSLPDGKPGNMKTVELMKKIALARAGDPKVRGLALSILQAQGIASHDRMGEALAIGDYVHRKVRYVKDPIGVELLTDPLTLIEQVHRGVAQGDCDDMALFIATLLVSIGIKPYFRMVRYTGKDHSTPFQHIYVVCYEQDLSRKEYRIVLDAILKDQPIGSEVEHESGEEVPAF